MPTVTLVPSSYTGLSNITVPTNSSYKLTNAYTDTTSSTSARLQTSTSGQYTGIIYYCFDTSSIPANAVINSVSMKAKWKVSSATNISSVSVQAASGTTLKGSANTTRSTSETVYTLNAGNWTREDLDDARIFVSFTRKSGGGSRYMYFYGAELIVDYTEASDTDELYFKDNGSWVKADEVYKKVNGSWILQNDLTQVFDQSTNYVKG